MDKEMSDIGWLATIITALGGWKLVEYLLNRHSIKRLTAAEAMQKELEAVMVDYRRMQAKVESLDRKVDELRKEVLNLQDVRLELTRENGELKVALKEAEAKMCLRPPESCLMRISPYMQCRELKLMREDYKKVYPDAITEEEELINKDENETDGISEKPDKG